MSSQILEGKTVVLAVTGSIAAYKMPNLARMLIKLGCDVEVLMTENATQFIAPLTFESLTGHRCLTDTFDRGFQYSVEHVALAKKADAVLIAPASADVIGKIANGIADDMLTTTVMACPCKKFVAPAMNHNMYHNPIVQDNLDKLECYGYEIIAPDTGMLANGDIGDGRMPDERLLLEYILQETAYEKDLTGKKILVTAGATREAIDPVRFITNHSSGKMGTALAEAALRRGAQVTLVAAHMEVEAPFFAETAYVSSAQEMYDVVTDLAPGYDIVVMAAAVADYCPATASDHKIKKTDDDLSLALRRTPDILQSLGEHKSRGRILCGFAMETEHLLENARAKLEKKNCDLICANSLVAEGAGFGTDTNQITVLTKDKTIELGLLSKEETAHRILDIILSL